MNRPFGYCDWFEFTDVALTPTKWPRRWRRAFLITLPISVPLYMALMTINLMLMIMLVPIIGIALWVGNMWMKE